MGFRQKNNKGSMKHLFFSESKNKDFFFTDTEYSQPINVEKWSESEK